MDNPLKEQVLKQAALQIDRLIQAVLIVALLLTFLWLVALQVGMSVANDRLDALEKKTKTIERKLERLEKQDAPNEDT